METVVENTLPDAKGRFGEFGGRYVPETLMQPLQELEEEYFRAQKDKWMNRVVHTDVELYGQRGEIVNHSACTSRKFQAF